MLPIARTTARNTMIAGLAALTLTGAVTSPALAWGKKEQGFVAGIATAIIIDELIDNNRARKAEPPVYAPPPAYAPPHKAPPAYKEPPRPHYTSVHSTPAAQAFKSYSLDERRAIQRRLAGWGFYTGAIDGIFGTGTYNAVVAYARNSGISDNLRTTGSAFAVYDRLLFR